VRFRSVSAWKSWHMAFLGSQQVSPNEVLLDRLLSALTCQDLAALEMVSAGGLRDLKAGHHWVVYFRQRLPHFVLAGECSTALEEASAATKISLSKLAQLELVGPLGKWEPVVLDSLEELRKLAVKLDVAEQTAKDARSQGHATTGAMIQCLHFSNGSVSTPVSFQLGSEPAETFLLQLGWTTNNDVLLRVTPKESLGDDTDRALSISVSTFGPGPQFVSRDSPVVTGGRWWTTNGLCTASKGPELLRSLRTGLWCVVCICQRPDNAPVPQSLRLTRVLDSLALQLPDDRDDRGT